MPSPTDKNRIGRENDRRRKVSDAEREEIIQRYNDGQSQRKIARETGVSRRQIGFIVDPERYKAHLERNKKNEHWKKYYDKDTRRIYMQRYRARLKALGKKPAK